MKPLLGMIWPQKLKYRLFMAFVLLILLPFFVLNIYVYSRIEDIIQDEISRQSLAQLDNLKRSLQDQMSIAFRSALLLEQDSSVRSILQYPQRHRQLDRLHLMEEKFKGLHTSFFLSNPYVYFMVLDMEGNLYNSYLPKKALNYDEVLANLRFQEVLGSDVKYLWVPLDDNDVFRDTSTSPYLLSLYVVMKEYNQKPYGLARVSIDYTYWFQSFIHTSSRNQHYSIITGQGVPVVQSDHDIAPEVVEKIIASDENGYIIDRASDTVVNFSYIDTLDWYVVSATPLDVVFYKIQALKQNYFLTFSLFMGAFILIAFMISYTITHPLSHMQMKMGELVRKDMKARLPEHKYKGELKELARTFNTMVADTNELIQRLKEEQRQKDAVHFQMLLAQVNPHFLLNTLNTMKWIAFRRGQEDIAEICMSLGKLLETSLNADVDLIYLKDELELIRAYVHIQQTRFNHSFTVRYEHDERNDYVLVPKLSLQPLVENAIQHGISGRPEGGRIVIRIRDIDRETLMLEVEDNGVGFKHARQRQISRKRPGIGLENIRQRLRLLFKDKGSVDIVHQEEGTLVRLKFPYMLSMPYREGEDQDVESHHRGG